MKKSPSKASKLFSLDNCTLIMGLIGQLASYVQAVEIFSTGSAGSVSLGAVLISISSVICWIIFGVVKKVKPLIYCNLFGVIGLLLVLIGIFWYRGI